MIQCRVKGNFKTTTNFLQKLRKLDFESVLVKYAEEGVQALSSATPKRTGKTAASWDYEIVKEKGRISIFWTNSNLSDGVPVAVILEYGHGTGWGGYVQGRHYISPAIQPVFDEIAKEAWKEVAGR
jgi:hypothetical protein